MKVIKIFFYISIVVSIQMSHAYHYSNKKVQKNKVWDISSKHSIYHAKSKLIRYPNKVCISSKTRNLPEGAYTVWWVLYNEPSHCSNPVPYGTAKCGDNDLFNPEVRATVMLASGKIVGPNGRMHLNSCINTGHLNHGVFDLGTKEGLTNPLGAEIQMIIRNHGLPAYGDPLLLGRQISDYYGGCDINIGESVSSCKDQQQIVHQADIN